MCIVNVIEKDGAVFGVYEKYANKSEKRREKKEIGILFN